MKPPRLDEMIELASRPEHVAVMPVSWRLAQWGWETGHGTSPLFLRDHNPAGMKMSQLERNIAPGEHPVVYDGIEYAAYPDLETAFRDWDHTLKMHLRARPGVGFPEILGVLWCPPGDHKVSGQDYVNALRDLILERRLDRYDIKGTRLIEVKVRDLKEKHGMDAWMRFLSAMMASGVFKRLHDLAIAFPQWIEEAERKGGDGETKRDYVADKVFAALNDFFRIPTIFGIADRAREAIEPPIDWVIDLYNETHGKDWGANLE